MTNLKSDEGLIKAGKKKGHKNSLKHSVENAEGTEHILIIVLVSFCQIKNCQITISSYFII